METQAYLDLKEMLGRWESVDLKVLLVHQGDLVRQAVQEILDSLVQQVRLVLLVQWETEDHLVHKVSRDSLDHQVFQECQELKEIEVIQEIRDHRVILDQLVDLVSQDLLV